MAKTRGAGRGSEPEPKVQALGARWRDWVWWSSAPGQPERAREEFEKFSPQAIGGLLQRIDRYLKGQSRRADAYHLGDGIYELRYRVGNNPYRILFMHWGEGCVALTAFYKNQRKTPKQDLERAKKRRQTWHKARGSKPSP
jgi:phage-related protein